MNFKQHLTRFSPILTQKSVKIIALKSFLTINNLVIQ
jgi:hypothetical protein